MKNVSKFKVEASIFLPLISFAIISIITLLSASNILPDYVGNVALKQCIWFALGFIISYGIMYIGNKFIYDNVWWIYGACLLLLILVLFLGTEINGSRCWFTIPGIGTFQPSEFMKVGLIIAIATIIKDFQNEVLNPTYKEEFKLILKIAVVTLIPSILTFLEPDTGAVIIYLVIAFIMLFVSGIRFKWFVFVFGIIGILIFGFFVLYQSNHDVFIDIFGTDLFYRIDRILNWQSGSGMQFENSIASLGSSGVWGYGFNNVPLYFPEAQNDFIFSVFVSSFGIIATIGLIALIVFFDFKLISLANKSTSPNHKFVLAGIIAMLLYQQIQNMGMTLGLLPITGITLPFISYGGSSLLSYMIMVGMIFNISNENLRYTN